MDISGATPQPDQQGSTSDPAAPGPGSPPAGSGVAGEALDAQPVVDDPASTEVSDGSLTAGGPSHLVRYLVVYSVLRLALVAVLTAVLGFFMPLIVALLFAIIVQLPLAWLLFAGPRGRVNEAMATASARRRAERARLQAALTGDVDAG